MTAISIVAVRNDADSARLHATPKWRAVVGEQVRAVGLIARSAAILLAVVSLVLAAIALWVTWDARAWNAMHPDSLKAYPDFGFASNMSAIVDAIAFLLPFFVWQDEDPTRRLYHWAMPVSRSSHSLAKVLAGWGWLMAATLLFEIVVVAVSHACSVISGEPVRQSREFEQWEWLVPFTSTTVAYLLTSAAVVGARRPLVWIAGVVTMLVGISTLLAKMGRREAFEQFTRAVFTGSTGIFAALGNVHFWDGVRRGEFPVMSAWLGSTALWGAIGIAVLALVSYRHSEPV